MATVSDMDTGGHGHDATSYQISRSLVSRLPFIVFFFGPEPELFRNREIEIRVRATKSLPESDLATSILGV